MYDTVIDPRFVTNASVQHFAADAFPFVQPVHWLQSHFAVGGWSPLRRLSGMLTAHMTEIAPHNGFAWHPHRGLEIYTWVLEGTLYHEDTTGGSGEIGAGELQRMFSGDWIEHQELNFYDEPARVIQIWFAADLKHRGKEPHYQQLSRAQLPARTVDDATIIDLIGGESPMVQHMNGRLTATTLADAGNTTVELPNHHEDLFLYVTDGVGQFNVAGQDGRLGQYDVLLVQSDAQPIEVSGDLDYLSFYLPHFLN